MLNTKKESLFISQKHSFHILETSAFPLLTGLFLLSFLVPLTFYMHGLDFFELPRADVIHIAFMGLYITVMSWFLSIIKESRFGFHTKNVQNGLRFGMVLFILSEIMFFFAFFWGFFHYSLVPSAAIGAVWPPHGTQELSPWGLPLVNTVLLLASGVTITVAHAYIVKNNPDGFFWYLFLTVVLGVTFLLCQAYEYTHVVSFSWSENLYGSIFFITTGFHGLHVTIGTLFLSFCWARHLLATIIPQWLSDKANSAWGTSFILALLCPLLKVLGYQPELGKFWAFTPDHHFGFEAAAWYWHFVDVVWLFLFMTIYWWGGK